MCGIVGIAGSPDDATLAKMMDALRHRGPDGSGIVRHGRVQIGAVRLAFLDLQAGAQPFTSEDDRISLTFNGEIYNHAALRARLGRLGHVFRTRCDTEVVLRMYEQYGVAGMAELDGMFAVAIAEADRLILARDRFGIKPLHYIALPNHGLFLFASEIKGLLAHPAVMPRLGMQAMVDWIALFQPAGTDTFLDGVRMLSPGHTLTVRCATSVIVSAPHRFTASAAPTRCETMSLEEAERQLETRLLAAVESHLAADVEIGVCLSGGVDSTLLALMAREVRPGPLRTFTVGPVGSANAHPDVTAAAAVARAIGATHTQVDVSFEDFLAALPAALVAMEGPCTFAGVPLLLLSRRISASAKGCLLGEGADELFGGYQEYADPAYMIERLTTRLNILAAAGLPRSDAAATLLELLSRALAIDEDSYLSAILEANMGSQLERHHLESVDKYAMASSVELRVPFLDNAVVDLARRLPLRYLYARTERVQKSLLKRILLRRYGDSFQFVVDRPKLGLPSAAGAFVDALERLCKQMLPASYLVRHTFGSCFTSVSELLMFDLFVTIFMCHRGRFDAVGSIRDFIATRR